MIFHTPVRYYNTENTWKFNIFYKTTKAIFSSFLFFYSSALIGRAPGPFQVIINSDTEKYEA